jgi:hypothetical protein
MSLAPAQPLAAHDRKLSRSFISFEHAPRDVDRPSRSIPDNPQRAPLVYFVSPSIEDQVPAPESAPSQARRDGEQVHERDPPQDEERR